MLGVKSRRLLSNKAFSGPEKVDIGPKKTYLWNINEG
jgi:hypothetical protein